jgi:hypothetical protein
MRSGCSTAHAVGGNIAHGFVERSDLIVGALEEFRFAQFLEARVPCHRKIGAIELQHKARGVDRVVLGLHRRDDGVDVRLVAGVVAVRLERGDHARRRGVHERLDGAMCAHGRREVVEIGAHGGAIDELDGTDAGGALERLPADHSRQRRGRSGCGARSKWGGRG